MIFSTKSYHRVLLMTCLVIAFPVKASDPSRLFIPVLIGLILIAIFLFGMSVVMIRHWVKDKNLRCLLLGFSFGLFLGPIDHPLVLYMPNIANLLFSNSERGGLTEAMGFALLYTVVIFLVYFTYSQVRNKSTKPL